MPRASPRMPIVRCGGYRTRGGESHHYVTFDVARSLVSDPDLRHALDAMNGLRRLRHAIEYEPDDDVDESMVATAVHLAEEVILRGARHVAAERPHLATGIRGSSSPESEI
jgi:hypothetical protein